MKNKAEQKLTEHWLKIYSRESDDHLLEVWKEDFEGRSTPRRPEDRARKDAIIYLLGDKLKA